MGRVPSPKRFRRAVRDAFSYLRTEYGFSEVPLSSSQPTNPVQVRFQSAATLVTVEGINWGHGVQVTVRRMTSESPTDSPTSVPLWAILASRDPELYKSVSEAKGQIEMVEAYATALRVGAQDILKGDFTAFPDARRIINERRLPP